MSTEEDGHTLTRKQLRELRLTGSTPVINGEEAAAAQPATDHASDEAASAGAPENGAPAENPAPAETPAPSDSAPETPAPSDSAPLTRRAARAQERSRTGSVPLVPAEEEPAETPVVEAPVVEEAVVEQPVVEEPVVEAPVVEAPVVEAPVVEPSAEETEVVSGIPAFTPRATNPPKFDAPKTDEPASQPASTGQRDGDPDRPMVGAAFGIGVKKGAAGHGVPAAFDELLETGSAGSHKTASTLIFTPSPGAGSLSGPVASTGELLITGSYSFPEGLGSQGHALGTTDGKDVDAVLIDGELAPASSPTPIAASSAISTSKPAGEVIRPPVPDKGNKLTLTLAIVAGGLALALAAALIIAFTTGVLG